MARRAGVYNAQVDTDAALTYLAALFPYLALAAVLTAMVLAINVHGRRLGKHADWLRLLDLRVGNLDKRREATWARHLQRPYTDPLEMTERQLVPPPLPPRAPTLNAVDWSDELIDTEEMQKKETGRYPLGIVPTTPPKGPDDDGTPT